MAIVSYLEPSSVDDEATIAEICKFRATVWEQTGQLVPNGFSEQGWRDPIDASCMHWIIRDISRRLVAAGRLSLHERLDQVHESHEYVKYGFAASGCVAAPDRVVVCPSAQGRGLGRQILDLQDQAAIAAGATCAVRQASPGMVKLIQRRGWHVLGPASPDERFPGVEFCVAIKRFSTHPAAAYSMEKETV